MEAMVEITMVEIMGSLAMRMMIIIRTYAVRKITCQKE
ncbi:unnamed protein product [Strongylus vulgaris]|uniref:Uncharacterized protein n=1 Tax=Strongylus vulgaris TaxID=40348 RepID=A0A3P7KWX4_STRVU|nr:unnamed protein product [Strongylus vulgaris]